MLRDARLDVVVELAFVDLRLAFLRGRVDTFEDEANEVAEAVGRLSAV